MSQIGISINNEFLDLLPGTRLDMEETNPFLQFDGNLVGGYSMPFEVRAKPENLRLLQWAGILQTRMTGKTIDCAVYDGGLQKSIGKLRVEQALVNLNRASQGQISLYYLTGASSFYQDVKDLKLSQVDFGGDRQFAWDGYNRAGAGFWAHIHQVIDAAPGGFDYAFFPVINRAWRSDDDRANAVMNNMEFTDGQVNFKKLSTDNHELNVIVPFPYLKYVLQRVVAQVGWKIDGAILDDTDFQKISLVNFQAIDWGFISWKEVARAMLLGISAAPGTHPATVTFNLADHMCDMSVSEFLLAVKNRLGWWYDFDRKTKTIHVQQLKNELGTVMKDMTSKASPLIPKKWGEKGKVYALKNDFLGEYAGGQPSLDNVDYKGPVNTLVNLPAPASALNGQVYLVTAENNFFICRDVGDANAENYQWGLWAYNVYDVVPPDATDDITTKATVLGVENYDAYIDLAPRMDLAGNWNEKTAQAATWGIHLVMYQGKRANKAGQPIPYACSHVYDSQGVQVSAWALAFQCSLYDGTQVGVYDVAWKKVLESLRQPETFEFTLYLTRQEMHELKFSDTITIAGVKMYLTKKKQSIPYNGQLQVESLRI